MSKYAEAEAIIRDMARVKMTLNSHKGRIEDVDPRILIGRLKDEVEELEEAIKSKNIIDVLEEAADVQNYVLAVVQKQLDKYRSRKSG